MKIIRSKTVQLTDIPGEYLPVSENSFEYSGPVALADRSQQAAGKTAQGNENNTAGSFGGQASSITGPLTSQLQKQAANPTGFNPTDVNNMLVASAQGAGGATSGLTGQADLATARTRNAGGFASSLDEAARVKNRQLSQNNLDVSGANANLKQKQMQDAQAQLGNLAGMDTKAQLSAMGLVPESINATVNAGKSGWLQNMNQTIEAITGGAKNAAGAMYGNNSGFANA
jgi:hypothetical protein